MISPAELDSMTNEQFDREAFALIVREFGLGGLARFIRRHRSGPGDYTAERHQWLDHLTPEEIEGEVFAESQRQQQREP
jgi:hypothetical protein